MLDPGFFPQGWGPYGPGVSGSGPVSAGPFPGFVGGLVYPAPKYDYYSDPASAPSRLSGMWQSQQRTDESGDKLQGDLNIDVVSDQQIVIMRDFPLATVEGSLSPFEYTRIEGEAPITFKAIFYRGYTVAFIGTADNNLCCRNHMCFWSGTFEIEGKYEIRDNLDQLADKGTFTLKGPASSPGSLPEPDEAIKILKKPFKEGREILSLTTGPDGHIYHSSIIRLAIMPDGMLYGITLPPRTGPNLPHGELFSYDPVSDKFTLFDMPSTMDGAIALAAGKDGLLYIAEVLMTEISLSMIRFPRLLNIKGLLEKVPVS